MKRDLKTELYVILSVYDNTLFQIPSSVSGTGRTGGDKGAGLPGHLPAWPRLPNKYPLRNRGPYPCGAGPASGRCHTRNEG